MKLIYSEGDLFEEKDCFYAHCISRDYKLGAGIAKEFDKRYNMRNKLLKLNDKSNNCIKVDNVYNLVTKELYWHKPTYKSLSNSLIELKNNIGNVDKLVIPLIGCGLDRLLWKNVEEILLSIFEDKDITIIVKYLKKDIGILRGVINGYNS